MQSRHKHKLCIYILHSPALANRGPRVAQLRSMLASYNYKNLDIEEIIIVTSHEPIDITAQDIQQYVNYDKPQYEHLQGFASFNKNLHINEVSHTLKHKHAIQMIASKNNQWGMVIEDDSLFNEQDVCRSIDEVFDRVNQNHGIVFLSMPGQPGANSSVVPVVKNEASPLIPVTENYLIHSKYASKLLPNIVPVKYSHNIHMNYVLALCQDVPCYQSRYTVFINGSKYGAYVSSTTPCNVLIFNREYMMLFDITNKIEKGEVKAEDVAHEVAELIAKAAPLNQHPDFLYQIGKYKILQGKHKEAQKLLLTSMQGIESGHGIVNHESWILRDLMRLYKHLQE